MSSGAPDRREQRSELLTSTKPQRHCVCLSGLLLINDTSSQSRALRYFFFWKGGWGVTYSVLGLSEDSQPVFFKCKKCFNIDVADTDASFDSFSSVPPMAWSGDEMLPSARRASCSFNAWNAPFRQTFFGIQLERLDLLSFKRGNSLRRSNIPLLKINVLCIGRGGVLLWVEPNDSGL